MLQGLASINFTTTQRFLITRFEDTGGSYIKCLPLLYTVTVLDLRGIIRGGRGIAFGASTLRDPLGTDKKIELRVSDKLLR